ncbi:hypothetical protein OROMI_001127 [Orobanche minor]
MAMWTHLARQAANVTRLCAPKSADRTANLVQRRGLSTGGGDHHGPRLKNEDIMKPRKWIEILGERSEKAGVFQQNVIGFCTHGLILNGVYKLVKFEMKCNKEQLGKEMDWLNLTASEEMSSVKVELAKIVEVFRPLPQDLKEAFANFQQLEELSLLEEQSKLCIVESKTVAVIEYTDSRMRNSLNSKSIRTIF